MKIRNGFVSNSSSSSFIINGKIDDVAKSMIKTVIEDFGDWGRKATKKEIAEFKGWKRNLEKALSNRNILTGKIGITMPSCNYKTYITQVGDQVYVQTSRNHSWDLDYVECGGGADDGDQDIVYKAIYGIDYFNVKNALIHSTELDDTASPCPECSKDGGYSSGFYVICNGKRLCSVCYNKMD